MPNWVTGSRAKPYREFKVKPIQDDVYHFFEDNVPMFAKLWDLSEYSLMIEAKQRFTQWDKPCFTMPDWSEELKLATEKDTHVRRRIYVNRLIYDRFRQYLSLYDMLGDPQKSQGELQEVFDEKGRLARFLKERGTVKRLCPGLFQETKFCRSPPGPEAHQFLCSRHLRTWNPIYGYPLTVHLDRLFQNARRSANPAIQRNKRVIRSPGTVPQSRSLTALRSQLQDTECPEKTQEILHRLHQECVKLNPAFPKIPLTQVLPPQSMRRNQEYYEFFDHEGRLVKYWAGNLNTRRLCAQSGCSNPLSTHQPVYCDLHIKSEVKYGPPLHLHVDPYLRVPERLQNPTVEVPSSFEREELHRQLQDATSVDAAQGFQAQLHDLTLRVRRPNLPPAYRRINGSHKDLNQLLVDRNLMPFYNQSKGNKHKCIDLIYMHDALYYAKTLKLALNELGEPMLYEELLDVPPLSPLLATRRRRPQLEFLEEWFPQKTDLVFKSQEDYPGRPREDDLYVHEERRQLTSRRLLAMGILLSGAALLIDAEVPLLERFRKLLANVNTASAEHQVLGARSLCAEALKLSELSDADLMAHPCLKMTGTS